MALMQKTVREPTVRNQSSSVQSAEALTTASDSEIAIEGLSEGLEIQEEVPQSEQDAAIKGSTDIQGGKPLNPKNDNSF